jgi:poly-gamma-glutamate capsule biosynthesis protein CapA/YwtB (metallophosphatase superfamily)
MMVRHVLLILLTTASIGMFVFIVLTLFCTKMYSDSPFELSTSVDTQQSEPHHTEPPPPPKPSIVSFRAVGDIMMHSRNQQSARNHGGYHVLFEELVDELRVADVLLGNLEVVTHRTRPISTYPRFNATPDLIFDLKWAGFDVLSFANNHTFDQGVEGVQHTLLICDMLDIPILGVRETPIQQNRYHRILVNNIALGFIGYTYLTNGQPMPTDSFSPFMRFIPQYTHENKTRMIHELNTLADSCDFLIASVHWGEEYTTVPNAYQKKVARDMVDAGVDLIVGHHPHVLQPAECIQTVDGRTALVIYSLGNFTSSMPSNITSANRTSNRAYRGDSVLFEAIIKKEGQQTYLSSSSIQPLWMLHYYDPEEGTVYKIVSIERELERIRNKEVVQARLERKALLEYRYEKISEIYSRKTNGNLACNPDLFHINPTLLSNE